MFFLSNFKIPRGGRRGEWAAGMGRGRVDWHLLLTIGGRRARAKEKRGRGQELRLGSGKNCRCMLSGLTAVFGWRSGIIMRRKYVFLFPTIPNMKK